MLLYSDVHAEPTFVAKGQVSKLADLRPPVSWLHAYYVRSTSA